MNILRILLSCLLLCTAVAAVAADDTAEQNELERIKQEMAEKKKELKRADRKERSVLSAIERIDRDIVRGAAELALQQYELREAESALHDVERSNAELATELAGLKRAYAARLRALYKMSRSGMAAAVLTAEGPGGSVKRVKYLSVVAERDRSVMKEFGGALSRLAARQAEIAEKRTDILGRQRLVETAKAELEARRTKKAAILTNVRMEKGLYEQTLRELEEASVSLWAMIKKDEQEQLARKSVNPVPAIRSAAAGHDPSRLPWPLGGQVQTRFGMQRHPQFGTPVFRRGIEIAAREGEEVRAVESGQIAYADWYKGYGKLIILDHGGGFYTLYGFLSRLDLKKGDRTTKGQVIGLAGETGSLKGSKLYFEIRRNGEAQDPLQWLAKR